MSSMVYCPSFMWVVLNPTSDRAARWLILLLFIRFMGCKSWWTSLFGKYYFTTTYRPSHTQLWKERSHCSHHATLSAWAFLASMSRYASSLHPCTHVSYDWLLTLCSSHQTTRSRAATSCHQLSSSLPRILLWINTIYRQWKLLTPVRLLSGRTFRSFSLTLLLCFYLH